MSTDTSIRVQSRHRTVREDGMAVEIDPRLPRSVWGRTLYYGDDAGQYVGAAHHHGDPHEFVCLWGECLIGVRESPGDPVTWQPLEQGERIHVPGGKAHRAWVGPGAILAAVSPALSWLNTTGVEWCPDEEDWSRL